MPLRDCVEVGRAEDPTKASRRKGDMVVFPIE
jgi:hypothetical protein